VTEQGIDRRGLLVGGAALALAGVAAAAPRPHRQVAPAVSGRKGLIDVHHHIRPPNAPEPIMKLMPNWTAQGAIDQMDRSGVATGMAYPGPILGGPPENRHNVARAWNEYGAKLGGDHPGRFGLFASLPLPHVAGCLGEIDYALDHLKADGFGIATSYGDMWLGDARLQPIWEKLDSRKAVVFVHPADAACCQPANLAYTDPTADGSWIEWPMNTARTIMSLMVSGTLRRYPNIRFIFSHGGGVMPLLVNRLAGFTAWDFVGETKLKTLFPDGIRNEFSRLHFECAQACSPANMKALRSLVPDANILFGSDYPYFPVTYAAAQFRGIGLTAATARAIGRDNAAAMLPRWA
jgi:predicted TIM-barrel fold metal-dependent hydrolase